MTPVSPQRLRLLATLAIGAALLTNTGCASLGQGHACPSWASFGSPEARYEGAEAVVTTTSARPSGTQELFGVKASAYTVTVDRTEKGSTVSGQEIRVVSMPDPCDEGDLYPTGDPMETDQKVRLYLNPEENYWITLTPLEGVEPVEE